MVNEETPSVQSAPLSKEENKAEEKGEKPARSSSGAEVARFSDEREKIDELLQVDIAPVTKAEVSASTVVKMMGLSTSTEIKLVESKIDLLSGRLGNLSIRLERVMNLLSNVPSTSDFERLEAQVASLRSLMKDLIGSQKNGQSSDDKATKEKLQAYLQKNQTDSQTKNVSQAMQQPEVPVKETTPAKEESPVKEAAPVKEELSAKESAPAKEESPAKEAAPVKVQAATKEEAPAKAPAPAEKSKAK